MEKRRSGSNEVQISFRKLFFDLDSKTKTPYTSGSVSLYEVSMTGSRGITLVGIGSLARGQSLSCPLYYYHLKQSQCLAPLDHQQTHSHVHPLNLLPKTPNSPSRFLPDQYLSNARTELRSTFSSTSSPHQNRCTTKPRHTARCRLHLLQSPHSSNQNNQRKIGKSFVKERTKIRSLWLLYPVFCWDFRVKISRHIHESPRSSIVLRKIQRSGWMIGIVGLWEKVLLVVCRWWALRVLVHCPSLCRGVCRTGAVFWWFSSCE